MKKANMNFNHLANFCGREANYDKLAVLQKKENDYSNDIKIVGNVYQETI